MTRRKRCGRCFKKRGTLLPCVGTCTSSPYVIWSVAASCKSPLALVWSQTERWNRSKYGLATTKKLFNLFGKDLGIGYDIFCSFIETILRSRLGAEWRLSGSSYAVPAFHGWGHNRLCQLKNHLGMSPGFGLEDLEVCERVFSFFNGIARCTRYASPFTRHQYMLLSVKLWNQDKADSASKFFALGPLSRFV